ETEMAKRTWVIAIAATILIFGTIFLIPDSVHIPNGLIPIIYTWIAYYLAQRLQGSRIRQHIESGGPTYSNWRAALVGVIGLLIIVSVVIVLLLFIGLDTTFTITGN